MKWNSIALSIGSAFGNTDYPATTHFETTIPNELPKVIHFRVPRVSRLRLEHVKAKIDRFAIPFPLRRFTDRLSGQRIAIHRQAEATRTVVEMLRLGAVVR